MDWGRDGGSAGGSEGVVSGVGGGCGGGGGGRLGVSSSMGGNGGEWDAGDGTVALRHLQNLAAQLPYGSWQVRKEGFCFAIVVVALRF